MNKAEKEALSKAADALISLGENYGFQVLMAQLRSEMQDDLLELATCDPTDHKKIAELQTKTKGLIWLKDRRQLLIQQGVQPEILEEAQVEHFDD